MMMGQQWLSKTKPKKAFKLNRNTFKKVATEFKKRKIT